MQPPVRLHPRDDNHSHRVLPQERFDAAWDALFCELPGRAGASIAPACGLTSRAVNRIAHVPITQEELAAPSCVQHITGRKEVYVRRLAYPGDASAEVLDIGAATSIASVAEAFIYVVDLRGPRVIAEVQVTAIGWAVRANPTRTPSDDGFVPLPVPGFVPFDADGNVDDYGFYLSVVRLAGEGFDLLTTGATSGTDGGPNPAREATVRARWGNRDRGYVVLPEPFRWAADAHGEFYEKGLDDFATHLAQPERAATRFIGRTLQSWVADGDRLGVENELARGGRPMRARLAQLDREDRGMKRMVEAGADYVRACVGQPDFRVEELSCLSTGGDALSWIYQVMAVVTHRLEESIAGGRFALELLRPPGSGPERLVRRHLLSDAVAPGPMIPRPYVAGASAYLLLSNLMFAITAVGGAHFEQVLTLLRSSHVSMPEVPLAEALATDPRALPPQVRGMRVPQLRPIVQQLGNALGHHMPQGQKSSFLILNGMFVAEMPETGDETLNQWNRAGRDFVLWNIQDKLGDKLPALKTIAKLMNVRIGLKKVRDAADADYNVARAVTGLIGNVASVVKMILKIYTQTAVAPAAEDATRWERVWRLMTRKIPGVAEGFGSRRLASRPFVQRAVAHLSTELPEHRLLGRGNVTPARFGALTAGDPNRNLLAVFGTPASEATETTAASAARRATVGGRLALRWGALAGGINSATEAALFAQDMVRAWDRDERAQTAANAIGVVGAMGTSVLELITAAVALGCENATLVAIAEMAWPAAIFAALLGLGYLLASATESNIYERYARWSMFGIHPTAETANGLHSEPWSPVELPAPGDPRRELRGLISLLSQFKIVRDQSREQAAHDRHTTILFSDVSDETVIRIRVRYVQSKTAATTVTRGEHVPLYPETRSIDRVFEVRGDAFDHPSVEVVRDHGRITAIRIADHVLPPPAPDPQLRAGEHWWTTQVIVRVQLERGDIFVPRNRRAWVELNTEATRAPTTTHLETLSHDGTKWVDAEGRPLVFAPSARPAPAQSPNARP